MNNPCTFNDIILKWCKGFSLYLWGIIKFCYTVYRSLNGTSWEQLLCSKCMSISLGFTLFLKSHILNDAISINAVLVKHASFHRSQMTGTHPFDHSHPSLLIYSSLLHHACMWNGTEQRLGGCLKWNSTDLNHCIFLTTKIMIMQEATRTHCHMLVRIVN